MRTFSSAPAWLSSCGAIVVLALLSVGIPTSARAEDGEGPAPKGPAEGGSADDAAQDDAAQDSAAQDDAAQEDVVVMKGGVIWRGRVILENEKEVVLERVSGNGGMGRITFDRADVANIRRGAGTAARPRGGPRQIRDEWFLLRSGGSIVGTRHLELWSDRTRAGPGFRIEETVRFFAQGPQLPATWTKRTEVVDLRFFPRTIAFREVGEGGEGGRGPRRYERNISGNVKEGVWGGFAREGGRNHRCEVHIGNSTRGRLGFREHLLRLPRAVRLLDARILEPSVKGRIPVRAGFASVTDSSKRGGGPKGHEFHWEENDRRLISYFGEGIEVIQEEIADGVLALPVSREHAEAAEQKAKEQKSDPDQREVQLPEAGIAFTAPDPVWSWKESIGSPANTGWRVLGRMDNRVLLSDVRVEWHPREHGDGTDPAETERWLLGRLRSAARDLKVLAARRPMRGVEGAWQTTVQATLKQESVRTIAVVVDQPRGRVVLLLAAPTAAWEQVRPALERFVSSIRLL